MSETPFRDALNEAYEVCREDVRFGFLLDSNEFFYGSCYGPWPPPKEFLGLRAILESDWPVLPNSA